MTPEEFGPPFLALTSLYDRQQSADKPTRDVAREMYFQVLAPLSARLWGETVMAWVRGANKWMPLPGELLALSQDIAPRLVAEREQAEVDEAIRVRLLAGPDPRAAEVLERLRSFRRIIGASSPAPARPQLEDHAVD